MRRGRWRSVGSVRGDSAVATRDCGTSFSRLRLPLRCGSAATLAVLGNDASGGGCGRVAPECWVLRLVVGRLRARIQGSSCAASRSSSISMPTTVFNPSAPNRRAAVKPLATLAGIILRGLARRQRCGTIRKELTNLSWWLPPRPELDRPPNRHLQSHGMGALGRSCVVEPPPRYTGQSLPEQNRNKHSSPQASVAREICTLGSMSWERKLFNLEMQAPALWRVAVGNSYSRHRRQAHTSSTLRRDTGGPQHPTATPGLGRPATEPACVQPNLPAPQLQRSQRVGERSSLEYMLYGSPQAVQPRPISFVQETQSAERQSA